MNPIRLTLVTHYFSTHRGGIEQAAGHLASKLAQRGGYSIEWFASDCDILPVMDASITMKPTRAWNGLEKCGIPWPVWSYRALKSLKASIQNCDVVHLHDFIYFGNIAAFIMASCYKKPVVITQHIGDASYISHTKTSTLKFINRTLGRYMLARAQQVICISEEVRRQFISHTHFDIAPLFWPNALDTNVFHPVTDHARQELRRSLGIESHQQVLLFVGRFTAMKGIKLMHELAKCFPQVQCWFAGWEQQQSALHPDSWSLPNVRVFKDRSGSSLADLYRAADLLILPSHSEGFPLVIQESMACGTPVLASHEASVGAPSAQSWIHTCSLSPDHSADARWKAALQEVLGNSSLSAKREPVADFARSEWAWEQCINRYAQLFEELTQPVDQSLTPVPLR